MLFLNNINTNTITSISEQDLEDLLKDNYSEEKSFDDVIEYFSQENVQTSTKQFILSLKKNDVYKVLMIDDIGEVYFVK